VIPAILLQIGYSGREERATEMKRKTTRNTEPVVPREILEQAKLQATEREEAPRMAKCVVCGGECPPSSSEGLCWVCRRLKISAWRDTDSQMAAQE
jgi:hypothetical protein